MRLNRETITLLVVSVVVILAVLLLTNTATAPDETATPAEGETGPLFADLEQDAIVRLAITDHENEAYTILVRDEGGAWTIEEATNSTDRATEQDTVEAALADFIGLEATNSFVAENLGDFGLDAPAYTIMAQAGEEETYTIHVGNASPTSPRYYIQREGDEESTVYLVPQTLINDLTNMVDDPPYVPTPTDTPTPFPTPNPYSEVEQTATAEVEQTATAEFEATATAEAEAEEETEEPDEEATEESEDAPTATDEGVGEDSAEEGD